MILFARSEMHLQSCRKLRSWRCFAKIANGYNEWKVHVFGVFLVCIFPHLDWIRSIQFKCRKIRISKTPIAENFHVMLKMHLSPFILTNKKYIMAKSKLNNTIVYIANTQFLAYNFFIKSLIIDALKISNREY